MPGVTCDNFNRRRRLLAEIAAGRTACQNPSAAIQFRPRTGAARGGKTRPVVIPRIAAMDWRAAQRAS
jgi:hypothetical protein